MDLLFKEYASPFLLLDSVISAGRFYDFLETFDKQREERQMWEFYLNKLPMWDERSFEEFKSDISGNTQKIERPSDEQLETTIQTSFKMMQNFEIQQEGG